MLVHSSTQLISLASKSDVRGLLGKIDEIRDLLRLTKFDLMCLCETFIDCNVAGDEISIQYYSVVLRNRNRHGGGVRIYVKKGIEYNNITNLDTHVECFFLLTLSIITIPLLLCNVYTSVCQR